VKSSSFLVKSDGTENNFDKEEDYENTEFKTKFKESIARNSLCFDNKLSNHYINENPIILNEDDNKNTIEYLENTNDYPILNLIIKDAVYLDYNTQITITPYSINDKKVTPNFVFSFGKNLETNCFNFPSKENVNPKQFEITYDLGMIVLNLSK